MQTTYAANRKTGYDFDATQLDCSRLVGNIVRVYSDQFPGRELTTRVLSITEQKIMVDSGTRYEMVDNLVSNQNVILQFPYRDQWISIKALFKRTTGGRCYFYLDEKATPLSQRQYLRVNVNDRLRMATVSNSSLFKIDLSTLRWIETDLHNFSSGGILVTLPSLLEKGSYLVVNINAKHIEFPKLILGKICYCYQHEELTYRAGVQFTIKEETTPTKREQLSRRFPKALFNYTTKKRKEINHELSLNEKQIIEL